ncbi:hypothetical protein CDL15_Pgr007949 [Punica granatum]|uniref:O-fucosyltransferase family protein n=1 Tax=Punica granatum TaxID=22663 RepID=A0A218XB21_PUNGR|nr:hypothetical protein CDL15_Pgr007949 [Punica granatum]PKI40238.1 hypothetical protein CRG98_039356 [Punica granatum]
MGVDLRQVVAGILTITMFVMLGNMIKREHFDSVHEKLPGVTEDAHYSEQGIVSVSKTSGPRKEDSGGELKPCWEKPESEALGDPKGSITFSLINGPEYHVSQISAAVVVAKYLGATLVIPDIRGTTPGDKRSFEDIYDVDKFMQSLDGVVNVMKEQPSEISAQDVAVVKVPSKITEDYIADHVEPVFRTKSNIRLATYFPSVNMRKKKTQKSELDAVMCLAMFGTLELQPEVREVVDSMVERLRTLSRKSDGRFLAVDLRVGMLERKNCQGSKKCFNAQEIAEFLQKIGYKKDTTIYLTQSRWDSSLDALKEVFPKTYTKESIMPVDKKAKFLNAEDSEFEKVIDYYICSESDVFVPAISGLFYSNVAGKRIASGRTQILVPAIIESPSASPTDHLSSYVVKKNHLAHSCFC